MLKKLKRIYLEGWNDDVGVRFWSWLLSLGGAFLIGTSGAGLAIFYKSPDIISYKPLWILFGIGCAFLLAVCFGMAWTKQSQVKLSKGKIKAQGRR